MPGTTTVLIVEDNAGDRELIQTMLEDAMRGGADITEAVSMVDAQRLLEAKTFDVVILDLNLGDCMGLETFHEIQRTTPGQAVIVLSGVDDLTVHTEAIEAGAQDCLLKKELSGASLARAIRDAVDHHVKLDAEAEILLEELRGLDEIDFGSELDWDSRTFGRGRLRNTLPGRFEQLAEQYKSIVSEARPGESRDGRRRLNRRMHDLAVELSYLFAEPRDVIDIHLEVCRCRVGKTVDHAFVRRSRWKLVELMGHLVATYLEGRRQHHHETRAARP